MKPNSLLQSLRAGQVQLGTAFQQMRSPEALRALAAAGFDWAFLDMEHGGFDIETIQDLCRGVAATTLTPVVRVPELHYSLVARALDCGAKGIVFPRVESPELLKQAVSWCKFPPVGIRGFGLTTMVVDYTPATIPQMIEHLNANTMVVLQIETALAVERREELISIPGIDAVMIGPVDLSISLGVPGDFQNPKMIEAMEAVRDTCRQHNVAPGCQVRNLALAKFWRDRGMQLVGCSSEFGMLMDRANEITQALR